MAPRAGCCSPGAYGEFFDEKLARRDAERYRRKGLGRASEAARRPRRRPRARQARRARGRRRHGDAPDRAARARGLAGDERRSSRRLRDRSPRFSRNAGSPSGRSGTSSTSPLIATLSATQTSSCFTVSSAAIPTTNRFSVAAAKASRLIAFSFPPDLAVSPCGNPPPEPLAAAPWLRLPLVRHSERAVLLRARGARRGRATGVGRPATACWAGSWPSPRSER